MKRNGKNCLIKRIGASLANALLIYSLGVGGVGGAGCVGASDDLNPNRNLPYAHGVADNGTPAGEDNGGDNPAGDDGAEGKSKYLIISAPEFKESAALQSLIERRGNDFEVNLFGMDEVSAAYPGEATQAIDDFVLDFYNSSDGNLKYVLLVGKRDKVPAKNFSYGYLSNGFTDNPLADIKGSSSPEISVGRFPVKNESDLENLVNKTIAFEESNTWENSNNVFVAGSDDGGVNWLGYGSAEFFDAVVVPLVPEGKNAIKIYKNDGATTPEQDHALTQSIIDNVNTGVFFVGYAGHGDNYMWVNTNDWMENFTQYSVDELANNIYPVFYAASCSTAAYGYDIYESLGEKLVNDEHGGAAYIGASTASGEFGYLDTCFYNGLYNADGSDLNTLGEVFTHAKNCSEETEPEEWAVSDFLNNEMNLLGDPALKIR